MIEVKQKIEYVRPQSKSRWSDLWVALDASPVGGGIQESQESLGLSYGDNFTNLRVRIVQKYGKGVFSFSLAGGMITIVRLKETQ